MFSTQQVANLLSCSLRTLHNAMRRHGVLEPPVGRFCGHLLWTEADVERARQVIENLRRPGRPKGTTKKAMMEVAS
jgi:hypothetical protein